jgi:protein tyrosine phosphatase (PTP) superfamily phosphohydrolase (DUF442 family)
LDDSRFSDIYNYRRVSERIATGGQPTATQLRAVAKGGCQVVINLGLHDADYALPNERDLVESLAIKYIYLPVVWERPEADDLLRFCKALEELEDSELFVHCAANVRVSVFIALDRIVRQGEPVDEALEAIAELSLPPVWRRFVDDVTVSGPQQWAERHANQNGA